MGDPLRDEIEAFLRLTGLSPSAFSERATKDRHFVRELRLGKRRVFAETAERVRSFMRSFDPATDPVPRRRGRPASTLTPTSPVN